MTAKNESDMKNTLSRRKMLLAGSTIAAASALNATTSVQTAVAQAQRAAPSDRQPNILVIMCDDVGWFNIGAYHQGIMSGKTPNLDRLAAEGLRFTDYNAEASCTAGRANFITGQIPLRTGLTTVGQAGADVGMPDQSGDHGSTPQVDGLRDRAVRQESSRRPEQVPADAARIR